MKFLKSWRTSKEIMKEEMRKIPIEKKILRCNPGLEAFRNAKSSVKIYRFTIYSSNFCSEKLEENPRICCDIELYIVEILVIIQ